VTLHVGIGTFRNLREENLQTNSLHSEWYSVPADTLVAMLHCKKNGGKVFACGTTVTRTLESAYLANPDPFQVNNDNLLKLQDKLSISGYTNIFIREGFEFQVVDGLLTNFHLPKSSLLMLVSAFAGRERVMNAYQHAIQHRYRFFSYGDAMLITPTRQTIQTTL
jgi:S-adenosylmethionine:tRNA ribosyltransferase-isomerase